MTTPQPDKMDMHILLKRVSLVVIPSLLVWGWLPGPVVSTVNQRV